MTETYYAGKMPILALRGLVVFPDQTVHFDVGRVKSIKALEACMKQDQHILLIPQKDLVVDDPKLVDLCNIGVIAHVKQVLKAQGDNLRVLVTGLRRAKIVEVSQTEPFLSGYVESVPNQASSDNVRGVALRREAMAVYGQYLEHYDNPIQAIQLKIMSSDDSGFVADAMGQNSGIDFKDKIRLLTQLNPTKRLELAVKLLKREVEVLQL